MPTFRRMKPNEGTETPSSLLFVDTETLSIAPEHGKIGRREQFRLGVATYCRLEKGEITRRDSIEFDDIFEFWEFVESKQGERRPLWVFAHNLGFDMRVLGLFTEIERRRFVIDTVNRLPTDPVWKSDKPFRGMMVLEGHPCFLKLLGKNGKTWFVDSTNYWPQSLASLGESLGIPKIEMPPRELPDSVWFRYCRRDVEILEMLVTNALLKWQKEDCGTWKPTAAGCALTSYRHKSPRELLGKHGIALKYPIDSHHLPRETALEREGYTGGHVEAFFYGAFGHPKPIDIFKSTKNAHQPIGPFTLLDFRSFYAHIMRSFRFPYRLVHSEKACDLNKLDRMVPGRTGCARVLIESEQEPFALRHNGRTIQGVGKFWTTLVGEELVRALDTNSIKAVKEATFYANGPIFTEWVDYWWDRRLRAIKRGDAIENLFASMLLKSLSGKWGQNGKKWTERPDKVARQRYGEWDTVNRETGEVQRFRAIAGIVQEMVDGEDPSHSLPIISACITAAGREVMRNVRTEAGAYNVLYQATDSVLVTADGRRRLERAGWIAADQLGKMTVKSEADEGEIWGANYYRFGNRVVCSNAFSKAVPDGKGGFVVKNWQGLAASLTRSPDGTVHIDDTKISPPQERPKNTRLDNQWSAPLFIWEPEDSGKTAIDRRKRPHGALCVPLGAG